MQAEQLKKIMEDCPCRRCRIPRCIGLICREFYGWFPPAWDAARLLLLQQLSPDLPAQPVEDKEATE